MRRIDLKNWFSTTVENSNQGTIETKLFYIAKALNDIMDKLDAKPKHESIGFTELDDGTITDYICLCKRQYDTMEEMYEHLLEMNR